MFAVHYNGKVYSIYKQKTTKANGVCYFYTYIGRKRFDTFPWVQFSSAVGSILDAISDFDKETYASVWL